MELRYQSGGAARTVKIERRGDQYRVLVGERAYSVRVNRAVPGEITLTIDGRLFHAHVAHDGECTYVAFDADVFTLQKADTRQTRRAAGTGGDASLAATMHGQVTQVLVSEGQLVARGQTLAVLEAMKMEIRVTAPHEGRVARLLCAPGQVVERGQTLLELANE